MTWSTPIVDEKPVSLEATGYVSGDERVDADAVAAPLSDAEAPKATGGD
jgi:hypothetical protein